MTRSQVIKYCRGELSTTVAAACIRVKLRQEIRDHYPDISGRLLHSYTIATPVSLGDSN